MRSEKRVWTGAAKLPCRLIMPASGGIAKADGRRKRARISLIRIPMVLFALILTSTAQAQTFSVLHSFADARD